MSTCEHFGRFMETAGCDDCPKILACYNRWRENEKKQQQQQKKTEKLPWYKQEEKLVCVTGSVCSRCGE